MPDIFDVWEAQHWEAPVVEEQYNPGRTILTLSFTEKAYFIGLKGQNEPINDTINEPINADQDVFHKTLEERIAEQLEKEPGLSQPKMAEMLGVSLSTVKRAMKRLIKAGCVYHEGSNKSGHWVVVKQNGECRVPSCTLPNK